MSTIPDINKAADLARFIAEKTHHNLFLTGKAGTGKTVFLRDFVAHTKKKVVVLAPTGIAAINANAMTIHSFCRFGLAPCPLGKVSEGNDFALEEKDEELVRNLDMIIIDEVSMVRADVMDHISEKIRLIRNSEEPFGGVQLLLIGDLYQLPPVVTKDDKKILKDYYGTNYFFFNSNAIKKVGFETVCLNKVYRQNNPEFVDILNRARVGKVSSDDCNKLNARCSLVLSEDKKYITLVAQKNQAEEINEENLGHVKGYCLTYKAEISDGFPVELYPTNKELTLKKGAQVMFIKNDKEGKYCNGTLGEIVALGLDCVDVKVGDKTLKVEPASWDNISYKYNKKENSIQTISAGTFKQLPLKPAWAITIHKSQGLSFDNAIIDIPRAFAAGQAYVALSRCRSLEGLVLMKELQTDSFFTDPLVSAFYEGVDSADYIEALANAVGFEPFEWDETAKAEEQNARHTETLFDRRKIAYIVEEIISDVDYRIYHQCLECAYELRDILKEIREAIKPYGHYYADTPYRAMRLNKLLYKEVSAIVKDKYANESWTLRD